MTGPQRCDEIIRVIDEVLPAAGAPLVEEASIERRADRDLTVGRRWDRLVRWGAVPHPLVPAR
jgi:hypothetical protein